MSTEDLPNKCNSCALRYPCPPNFKDVLLNEVEILFKKRIIPKKYPMSVTFDCKTDKATEDLCLLDRPAWADKNMKCNDWQLRFDQSTSESMSLHLANKMDKMTNHIKIMTIIMAILALISTITTGITTYNKFRKTANESSGHTIPKTQTTQPNKPQMKYIIKKLK